MRTPSAFQLATSISFLKFLAYLLIFNTAFASLFSQPPGKKSIYFESAKHELSDTAKKTLDVLCDSLKTYKTYRIIIRGNTDNVGDSIFNMKLSENRVNAAMKYMLGRGISPSAFTSAFLGENKPLVTNESEEGKQKNRRVDIFFKFTRHMDSAAKLPSILELYRKIERPTREFCIDPLRDTTLRIESGTLIYIRANSFKLSNACKKSCVRLAFKECRSKSDMILDNMSTMMDDSTILQNRGAVYIQARDCNGKNATLRHDMELIIITPTKIIDPETWGYGGMKEANDSCLKWLSAGNAYLAGFSENEIMRCTRLLCGIEVFDCNCDFLFCRVKRLDDIIVGLFSRCKRNENRIFRKRMQVCRLENVIRSANANPEFTRKEKSRIQEEISDSILLVLKEIDRINSDPDCPDFGLSSGSGFYRCYVIRQKLEMAGIRDINDLLVAMYGKTLDSIGLNNIHDLADTIRRIREENSSWLKQKLMKRYGVFSEQALNDTLTSRRHSGYRNDSLELAYLGPLFYLWNADAAGWSGIGSSVDVNEDGATMTVNLECTPNTDCKLVFMDQRVVVPPSRAKRNYQFKNLPPGKKAWIVALKYLDGKAYLYIGEVVTGNDIINVEFKEYSLDELREKLLELNR